MAAAKLSPERERTIIFTLHMDHSPAFKRMAELGETTDLSYEERQQLILAEAVEEPSRFLPDWGNPPIFL